MVNDHSDSERGNPLPPHRLFPINSKGSFICIIPDRIAHTTFVIPVMEDWQETRPEVRDIRSHSEVIFDLARRLESQD